jgi:selenocysteine-specific translation elongation factor
MQNWQPSPSLSTDTDTMTSNRIKVGRENTTDIEIYYQDLGSGNRSFLSMHGHEQVNHELLSFLGS